MNDGMLSGYFSGYEIVGTQNHNIEAYNGADIASIGYFVAPQEATHALISACACGRDGDYLEFIDPETYYGSTAAGGGGAACYRVSFELSVYRYVPYVIGAYPAGVKIGANAGTDLVSGPVYGGFPTIILNDGGSVQDFVNGGNGGGATWGYQNSNTSIVSITASGGAGGSGAKGGSGKVVVLYDGGIISGGSGGGGSNADGGNLHTPFGFRRGGTRYATQGTGGGGASFYADGIGGYYDYTTSYVNTAQIIGVRSNLDLFTGGYHYSVPGAGMPGRVTAVDDDTGYNTYRSTRFIYCEFIAPRGSP